MARVGLGPDSPATASAKCYRGTRIGLARGGRRRGCRPAAGGCEWRPAPAAQAPPAPGAPAESPSSLHWQKPPSKAAGAGPAASESPWHCQYRQAAAGCQWDSDSEANAGGV
jgi:hypothetical protein